MKEEAKLREIKATVMRNTEESLRKISQESGMTIGEVIDRLTLRMCPKDVEIALQLIEEEIIICFSGLDHADCENAFVMLVTDLVASLPINEAIVEKLIEGGKKAEKLLSR